MEAGSVEQKLRMTFDSAVKQLRRLSSILEFGQSATPLAHYLSALEEFSDSERLSAIVLGVCPDSTVKLVQWIAGCTAPVISPLLIEKRPALVELLLQGSGYAVEGPNGRIREFSDSEAFLGALEDFVANQGVRSGTPDVLRIRVPCDAQSGISTFYVVGDPQAVRDNAPLFQTLVSGANLIVIGAPPDFGMSGPASDLMDDLSLTTDAVLPVIVGSTEHVVPEQGWWISGAFIGRFGLLPPVLIGDVPIGQASFTDAVPGRPITQALRFRLVAEKLSFGVAATTQRLDEEIKLTNRRIGSLEERSRIIQSLGKVDLKASQDSLRLGVETEIQRLIAELDTRNRIAFEPYGKPATTINAVIEGLTDLDREVASAKSVRLEVPQEFSVYLKKLIEEKVKESLARDVAFLNMSLRVLFAKLNEQLNMLIHRNPGIHFSVEDEDRIADSLRTLIVLDVHSRGELPKANLMRFLSSARQMAFMLIITLQLVFGGIFLGQSGGGSLRQILGPFMGIMLLGGIIYSIISFRKDRQEIIDKELARVKESLSADSRRVLNDIQREKLSRLTAALNSAQKRTARAVDELLKEHTAGRIAASEKEVQALQAQMRHFTQRLRKLQEAQKSVAQVIISSDALQASSRNYLYESVKMSSHSQTGDSVAIVTKTETFPADGTGEPKPISTEHGPGIPVDPGNSGSDDSRSASDGSAHPRRITLRQRLAGASKQEK